MRPRRSLTAGLAAAVLSVAAITVLIFGLRELVAPPRRGRPGALMPRILFPLTGSAVSLSTLDAALWLARSRDATLVPAYLVIVPRHLSLESPAPVRETEAALPVLELIDQRAARVGVTVDSRVERGRTYRDAMAALMAKERFDTLAVPAGTGVRDGFARADVEWLLERAPAEAVVLAPELSRRPLRPSPA